MAKNAQATYSDDEQFDSQFKKRQNEINNEITIWSQSEAFRSRTREILHASITDHDALVNLSKRLFENGVFTANLKEIARHETESAKHKLWMDRLSTVGWLALGGGITFLIEFLLKYF